MKVVIKPIPKDPLAEAAKMWVPKGDNVLPTHVTIEPVVSGQTKQYDVRISPERLKELSELTGEDLSLLFRPDVIHPFWGIKSNWLKLPRANSVVLDTSIPMDEIKLGMAKASPTIANSMEEYDKGLWPFATHVIDSEEEEVERKAQRAEIKQKAYEVVRNLTSEQKAEIILLLDGILMRKKSAKHIDVKMQELLDKSYTRVLRYAEMDTKELHTRALVEEAIYRNILTKQGSGIYYGDSQLGFDKDDAVKYFSDPQNQKLKLQILDKINSQ